MPGSNQLTVTFLDVGDGLCTIVRTPSGRTMVVDCGTSSWHDSTSVGRKLAGPYLQSLGVDSIDVVVLSHPHSDHESGLAGLLKLEPARLVLDTGVKSRSPEYRAFISSARVSGARYRAVRRGQVLDLGDGVKAEILSPPADADYADLNNRSMVLRVTYKRSAILLAADAGEVAERAILDTKTNVRAQVLQVGHHGSRDATSPEWLSAVRPSIAVISCARYSRYHFPSTEVTRRLSSCGARTYITGRCGAVSIASDGESVRVDTFKAPP